MNIEGFLIIYKCVEDFVVREIVVMERFRIFLFVGGGSNIAEKGIVNGKYYYIKKKLKRDGFFLYLCDVSFKI